MNQEQARSAIQKKLDKVVDANPGLPNAYLLIHSDGHGIHWNLASGTTGDVPATAGQPYHTASIGKTFTAVIVAVLAEEGRLDLDDPISMYLSDDLLDGLHVYKGQDCSREIRISHLLGNTSGIGDFFEDKPTEGKPFLDVVLDDPSRVWTPEETIEWSKRYYKTRFPVGKKCHYTNTGYNLLGLIIERVTSKPYHEVLHEYIFDPLNMRHSYLSQFSAPAVPSSAPLARLNANDRDIDVEDYRSFTSFYAGGQTVSTSEDLLVFMKALVEHDVVEADTQLSP